MTTQQMLDERYGRTRSPRRRAWTWATIGTLAVIAVGLLVWGTIANTIDAVDGTATAYTVVDARTVTVDFQVSAPVGAKAVCVLEADDEEHGIVGWLVVQLPASTGHTHAYSRTVPTVGEATTGLVNSCWVP